MVLTCRLASGRLLFSHRLMTFYKRNHYVPEWHQRHFFEPGKETLAYRNLDPGRFTRRDGSIAYGKSRFDSPPSRCFFEDDLYTTFFDAGPNDEIERRLFGAIDTHGSRAIAAYLLADQGEWHRHFQTLFDYIDIQKIRTPKGLAWLRAQYPEPGQNDLMMEMQGIRNLHCTIWTTGVREIVSAEDSAVKFILTDHPVTVYNHAVPPGHALGLYPNDPPIALKASQTLFPLSRDFCLILTNLEYAQDPACPPLEKRTFARNFRNTMVSTINFIRSRRLAADDVVRINRIFKAKACKFIAAGREEWLNPEAMNDEPWSALGSALLPPHRELGEFGGEMMAQWDSGDTHYQDAFGRTEGERPFLVKPLPERPLRPIDACGCGSGIFFKECCKPRPVHLRPAWDEKSIRERNLMLHQGIVNILEFEGAHDWARVRRSLTDEKIVKVYRLYQALWPLETDLLKLLPKPDGRPRAIYTGSIHPNLIGDYAFAASAYFGELHVEHPFAHPGVLKKEFNPVENPHAFHLEFLKSVVFLNNIMPLVDLGIVNLVPDPCDFDPHLRLQMMRMAEERAGGISLDPNKEPRLKRQAMDDLRRDYLMFPPEGVLAEFRKDSPGLDDADVAALMSGRDVLREADPLVGLRDDIYGGEKGGQMRMLKLAPNFEIAMYLAQATGAAIVTDSPYRWEELRRALRPRFGPLVGSLDALAARIGSDNFIFPNDPLDVAKLSYHGYLSGYSSLFADVFRYLGRIGERGRKPNWEANVAARFERVHRPVQTRLAKLELEQGVGRIACAFPAGGIQDNTINRLLLMSSSEHHLKNVPMAFFMGPAEPAIRAR